MTEEEKYKLEEEIYNATKNENKNDLYEVYHNFFTERRDVLNEPVAEDYLHFTNTHYEIVAPTAQQVASGTTSLPLSE